MIKINEFNDECPAHGGETKREYNFGAYDATVYTFSGCKCAAAFRAEAEMYDGGRLFQSYEEATAYARLTVAAANAN